MPKKVTKKKAAPVSTKKPLLKKKSSITKSKPVSIPSKKGGVKKATQLTGSKSSVSKKAAKKAPTQKLTIDNEGMVRKVASTSEPEVTLVIAPFRTGCTYECRVLAGGSSIFYSIKTQTNKEDMEEWAKDQVKFFKNAKIVHKDFPTCPKQANAEAMERTDPPTFTHKSELKKPTKKKTAKKGAKR